MNILMIGFKTGEAEPFAEALAQAPGVSLERAATPDKGEEMVRTLSPRLAVLGPGLPEPRAYLGRLMMINAMVYTAVASPLSEEDFHEEFEGLGVLTSLPEAPTAEDAARLLDELAQMP